MNVGIAAFVPEVPDEPECGQGLRVLRHLKQSSRAFVRVLERGYDRWCLLFSGGKDSTAAVVVALETALQEGAPPRRIDVIYSDTGMEIPVIQQHALGFMEFLRGFERLRSLPISCHVVRPPVEESFWVCLLGRGYPPPHQRFRWCTRRLKIEPAEEMLRLSVEPNRTVIVTGVRFGESPDRDRRLSYSCRRGGECGQGVWFQHSARLQAGYLAPLAHWNECDVWDFLNLVAPQWGYPTRTLETDVYNGRGTRFGCWMCTVVRQDRAMERITSVEKWAYLRPLMEFRRRVMCLTSSSESRYHRSGGQPGRLSLKIRRQLLRELLQLEECVGLRLITDEEVHHIERLWADNRYGRYD